MQKGLIILLGMLVAASPVLAGAVGSSGAIARGDLGFNDFCRQWMEKLRAREQFNRKAVKWELHSRVVTGQYTGYGRISGCTVKRRPGGQPIGRLTYREITYRLEGQSRAAAAVGHPRVVGETEVTEIFRYSGGRWQY